MLSRAGRMLRDGIHFNVSDDVVTVNERNFARGRCRPQRQQQIRCRRDPDRLARETRYRRDADRLRWTGATSFGASKIISAKIPRIALVGGPRFSATS